jgi:hypothetical protein
MRTVDRCTHFVLGAKAKYWLVEREGRYLIDTSPAGIIHASVYAASADEAEREFRAERTLNALLTPIKPADD